MKKFLSLLLFSACLLFFAAVATLVLGETAAVQGGCVGILPVFLLIGIGVLSGVNIFFLYRHPEYAIEKQK